MFCILSISVREAVQVKPKTKSPCLKEKAWRKLLMRINHNHFVYIISLPELAWKKCKQTGLWFILVDTFWLYWFFIILSMMESTQIWPAVLSDLNHGVMGKNYFHPNFSKAVRLSLCHKMSSHHWSPRPKSKVKGLGLTLESHLPPPTQP